MSKLFFQREIPKRSLTCHLGKETLAIGDHYHSILCDLEDQSYQRFDFCENCWQTSAKNEWSQKAKTQWKSIVLAKNVEPQAHQSKDEKALINFKELANKNIESEDEKNQLFMLGLYLARRKFLALRQEIKEGQAIFQLYEEYATEEMFKVQKIDLATINIEAVQSSLADKLTN